MTIQVQSFKSKLVDHGLIQVAGYVQQSVGLVLGALGPPRVAVGEVCRIMADNREILAEVVGFTEQWVLLMPLGEAEGIRPGSSVFATGGPLRLQVSNGLLGRVIDGLGAPIDRKGELAPGSVHRWNSIAQNPLSRRQIDSPLSVGVRAIDGCITIGQGQRMGIFAGSGVGKSTLLGMMARYTSADINVIALIGERGREVKEFIENDLGTEALARSVVVVATSDQPALVRIKGAYLASTIAEYFRAQGKNVLLMMDSVTRFAMAQRELGLAVGEPPTMKGYPPSVFGLLPKLLERSGTSETGTITGLYTVLVDADDFNEPISDAVRSILDGHIVLSRELAHRNHYPAIDILASLSRVMPQITTDSHRESAGRLREILSIMKKAEDLINIGAYISGSNPKIDEAITKIDAVNNFLLQKVNQNSPYQQTLEMLGQLFTS